MLHQVLLSLALLLGTCGGPRTCGAMPPMPSDSTTVIYEDLPLVPGEPRLAIDTTSAHTLAEFWMTAKFPNETTFCLYGDLELPEGEAPIIEITSVQQQSPGKPCRAMSDYTKDAQFLLGMVGFIDGNKHEMSDVTAKLAAVLGGQPDLLILGEIYAVTRVQMDGSWHNTPRIWAAVRG